MGKENEVNGDKYVAIDFGAESGRLILGYLQNGKLAMEEIHRFKTQGTMIRGQLRWNVLRLWEEVLTGLQKYVKKFGPKVNGLGVDSWGVSPVGLDEYGNLAYTPFHYRASLVADPMLEEFQKQISADYIFDTTGI